MKEEELKQNDGKEGRPTLFAFEGKVYDVSLSRKWRNGAHMMIHHAGTDLTSAISAAPHGTEVITERFKSIAELEASPPPPPDPAEIRKEKLRGFYRAFHPHPVLVHFPISGYIFSVLMIALFRATSSTAFETAAFASLVFATAGVIPATLGGFLSWWINYDKAMTSIFRKKIYVSLLLVVVGLAAIGVRVTAGFVNPQGALMIVYELLVIACAPMVLFVAYQGGKITFPS